MKSSRWILVSSTALTALLGVVYLCSCQPKSTDNTAAQPPAAPQVPADGRSATAAVIASHLEEGGEFYAVVDIKGELEKLGDMYASLINQAAQQDPGSPLAKVDMQAVFKRAGLYGIDGGGMSSWQAPNDVFHHNRAFLYTPNGRDGLLKVFGGAPGPFITPQLAPADADLVFESTLDLKSLVDLITGYAQDFGGAAAGANIKAQLSMKVGPTTLTWQDLVNHLNTRVTVILRADPKDTMDIGPNQKLPVIDALIALDGFYDVYPQLEAMAKDDGDSDIGEKNGMKTITAKDSLPPPVDAYKPMIIGDPTTKRVYIVSRPSFADQTVFGQGPRLSSSPDFMASTADLPKQGNALTFLSKKGTETFKQYYGQMMQTIPAASRQQLIDFSFGNLDKATHGMASTQVNLPDGILVQSIATNSSKQVVLLAPVAGIGLLSAMAIPAFSKVRAESRDKAITNNLRQIAAASMQYMLDKGVTSVRYRDLITGPQAYIRPVTPVMGESYDDIVVRQDTTQISVTAPDGETITYNL